MDYLIAVDIGTSSTKVLTVTPGGRVLHRVEQDYPMLHPQPGWSEQDPGVLLPAILSAVRMAVARTKGTPGALGLSSAMHSLLAVDPDGRPLGNLITWADRRSQAQADRLNADAGAHALYAATGVPAHPMTPLCKLAWLREADAERFRRAARFYTIKSYLLQHLFDRFLIDYSDASSTGLFDIRRYEWYGPALELAGIRREQLPRPAPTTTVLTGMGKASIRALGLEREIPVIVGASDGCLANLGSQVLQEGAATLSIGTSGAIRCARPAPLVDPRGRLFNYLLTEEYYISGGAVNNGAYLLQWFRSQLAEGRSIEQLMRTAEALPPGAGGLLFLPYLLGERAPVWDSRARAAFVGLTESHGAAHLFRSMLEGICFNLYECGRLLEQQGAAIAELYASGGFTQSPFWVQLLADVFGRPVLVEESREASALGAVILALFALDRISSLEKAPGFGQRHTRYQPDEQRHRRYQEFFEVYQKLYPGLTSAFHQLNLLSG